MTDILQTLVDWAWGLPLVIFLFAANLILIFYSGFKPILKMGHALKLLAVVDKGKDDGEVPHFQTFCNAMAATVGMGNISGVAIAIAQGGPGTVFWMWIAAVFGMNTKLFESTSALLERGQDYRGNTQGGAMYTIVRVMHRRWWWLATLFAVCGMVGTLSLFQINQLGGFLTHQYAIPGWVSGVVFSGITLYVLRGGLQRLSAACAMIVPFMGVIYTILCLVVLGMYWERLPQVFALIFQQALRPEAAGYGIAAYTFVQVMVTGIKRATFSNEAGLGTAPMAHSNTSAPDPVSEGYVAMLGPFIDTIVGCTLTALVILAVFPDGIPEMSGIELSIAAFSIPLGAIGRHLLGVSVLLFAYATILGMANYNQKCWDFLFKGRRGFGATTFQCWYAGTVMLGAILAAQNVLNVIDIAYALMVIPNVIVTLLMAPRVKTALIQYDLKNEL
jgi:AGCS family alanine or glycine:cation symporter